MKNRKAFGTLQVHKIQQREVAEKMGLERPKSFLDDTDDSSNKKKPLIEVISSDESSIEPEYRVSLKNNNAKLLHIEVFLPGVVSIFQNKF